MLLNILLVILVVDCIALTGVILLQRSEGGALGMGGGPSGIFTARGAGDLLTRTTAILTVIFFVLSLVITLLAGHSRTNSSVTERTKINPIDLNALAGKSAAPAASGTPAAPPLPTAIPPLPSATQPAPAGPAQPQGQPRRAAPRAVGGVPTAPVISVPALPQPRAPRPDLNAPATPGAPPPPSGQ